MKKTIRISILLCLLFFLGKGVVKAQEVQSFVSLNNEVVFLVDCSGSMKGDKDGQLKDALTQILYSLPTDTRVGFVNYNSQIQNVAELGSNIERINTMIKNMEYQGYSHAGLGLNQAVALFSETSKVNRHIILFSDGEIDMKNKEEAEASIVQFREELKTAEKKGINIYVVDTSDGSLNNTSLFQEVQSAGGTIYSESDEEVLAKTVEKLIVHQLGYPWKAAGSMEGKSGSFHLELPTTGISRAKIFLVGEEEIQQIDADYQAKQGQLFKGKYFALFDLIESKQSIDIRFELNNPSTVKCWLMLEYEAQLAVDIRYRSEPKEQQDNKETDEIKYADLEISLVNRQDRRQNLWNKEELEGKSVIFQINEKEYQGMIEEGVVHQTLLLEEGKGQQEMELILSTGNFPEIYREIQPLIFSIEFPPEPVEEVDYRPLIIILSILIFTLLLIFFLWRKKEGATLVYVTGTDGSKKEKYETKTCQYTGKFNLYVVQTKSGRDYPPQSIRLFGRKSNRITLEWMLNTCSLKLGNPGAEDIAFYPGPDKAIIVMDQSEGCTVMRGMEILKKGMGYPVYYNEKLTITLEDGITELEIHYKNLKPSEREEQK